MIQLTENQQQKITVLAFEDNYDIEAMLRSSGVDMSAVEVIQMWNSHDSTAQIREHNPDILALDFFMPPKTGLQVLQELNDEVAKGTLKRPMTILAMSSEASANARMMQEGADLSSIKFDISNLEIWPRSA